MAGTETSTARRDLVDRARQGWIRRLVDLSRRNNLLYFRSTKTGTLDLPGLLGGSHADLLAGKSVPLRTLCSLSENPALAGAVTEIRRRATTNQEERGLETLYVAFGSVSWQSDDGGRNPDAPVLLLPVTIQVPGRDIRQAVLRRSGGFEVNPVLLQALSQEHGIELAADELLPEDEKEDEIVDIDRALAAVSRAGQRLTGLQVGHRAVLGNFSFQKLAMVRDLRDCGTQLANHDVVAALAGDSEAREAMRPPASEADPRELDRIPPENEFLVRDADASQLQVIASTMLGEHVVVQGPPGTGKSQTISNLIASLAASGKRVLFVAEKRAALNVVLDRLEKADLGHLTLDVHGADLTRKEVARQIKRTLSVLHNAPPIDATQVHDRFADRRARLNGHVGRLHAKRQPSGLSVFSLQGRLLRTPPEVRSRTRWRGPELDRLTKDSSDEIADLLQEAGAGAGLFLGTDPSPWTGAEIETGTKAQACIDATARLHGTLLPALRRAVDQTCSSLGFRDPRSIAEIRLVLTLLSDAESLLRVYDPAIFEQDLAKYIRDLAPAGRSSIAGSWAWVTKSGYRTARRTLNDLRRAGRVESKILLQEAKAALDVLVRWRGAALDQTDSVRMLGSDALKKALAEFAETLVLLSGSLPQKFPDALEIDEIERILGRLVEDSLTPYRLPRVMQIEREISDSGASAILAEIRATHSAPERWEALFRNAWHTSCLDRAWTEDPDLAAFVGRNHDGLVADFKVLDQERLRLSASRVAREHAERAIAAMNEYPEQDALVRSEAAKQSRHLPIRKLLFKAPDLLTAICPCWMASPLSVSQIFGSDRRYFDVVIFDEASQVLPEDAIPAIMRASQVVVAGDRHQLPPTTFFADGGETDDAPTDEDPSQTVGFESLLDLLSASSARSRMLTWHYRSRDEALIAFSNGEIYDWRLVTFPGPTRTGVLRHVLVQQPVVRGGEEDSSSAEVQRVVELVLEHARSRPTESLGVIALGIRHAIRVEAAIDAALNKEPSLEAFFDPRASERFFVKNLERVQGDERDAIILTVGLANDRSGTLLNRLGPLNYGGGERRLNVAITRARSSMTVVSSFTHHEMDPTRFRARGAEMLRLYLQYAASEGREMGPTRRPDVAPNDFEIDVATALEAKGIQILPQVGASAYRIDLVAQHPRQPGKSVLAIECDGATYHSSPTARDRDRLRQQHLESLGWRFHRIWSTDWFLRKDEEIDRAVRAYEKAVAASDRREPEVELPGSNPGPQPGGTPQQQFWNSMAVSAHDPRSRRPSISRRGSISEYSQMELVRLVTWVKSDGRLRTDDQILDLMVEELGFKKRGHRIVDAIMTAIEIEKNSRRESAS
ncbi:MAG: AAA domain-containing protein [Planctomycetota bacterium]